MTQVTADDVVGRVGETIPVRTQDLIVWQEILAGAVENGKRLDVARVQIAIQTVVEREFVAAAESSTNQNG